MEKERRKFKGTEGNWEVCFDEYMMEPKKICIGVGVVTRGENDSYTEYVCNSLLPNTDKEYIQLREHIEADMRLIAAAPKMLKTLKKLEEDEGNKLSDHSRKMIEETIKSALED